MDVMSLFVQALPAFRSLLLARKPIALSLKNMADQPLILRSVDAKVFQNETLMDSAEIGSRRMSFRKRKTLLVFLKPKITSNTFCQVSKVCTHSNSGYTCFYMIENKLIACSPWQHELYQPSPHDGDDLQNDGVLR